MCDDSTPLMGADPAAIFDSTRAPGDGKSPLWYSAQE